MNWQPEIRQLKLLKVALFLICLLPLGRPLWAAHFGEFGALPEEFLQRWSGDWTCNFLLLTLCVTPMRSLTQLHWLMRFRRMLGLFAFFYATLHFLSFAGFDHDFALNEIARDILKRPFITLGLAAFALLIPLAATANQWAIEKLGGKRWQELHRNIYLIAILAAAHYLWLAKGMTMLWAIAYSAAVALLLGWRIRERRRRAIPVARVASTSVKPLRFFKQKPE